MELFYMETPRHYIMQYLEPIDIYIMELFYKPPDITVYHEIIL